MIRVARIADVKNIQALMKSVDGFWDETWRSDVLERALIDTSTIAFVHVDRQEINGFICAHDLGFRAYLSKFVVSPSSRGVGIGARLLTEIERCLADRGCNIVIADRSE